MDDNELFDAAENRTHALLHQAERHYNKRMPNVGVRFDLSGKSAGMVRYLTCQKPLVRYNAALLNANRERFLAQTVPHEVAHIVARALFGLNIKPHGPEWKAVMQFFGADLDRCHSYDTSVSSTRRLRRFPYACGCREYKLTSIRHNRIKAGQVYLCMNCGAALSLLS